MLEQQKQASQGNAGAGKYTQLEGIRQKVFMDRYSLKDPSGQPLEFYPEQLWARVARGIASVETTEEKQAYWEKRFFEALADLTRKCLQQMVIDQFPKSRLAILW